MKEQGKKRAKVENKEGTDERDEKEQTNDRIALTEGRPDILYRARGATASSTRTVYTGLPKRRAQAVIRPGLRKHTTKRGRKSSSTPPPWSDQDRGLRKHTTKRIH